MLLLSFYNRPAVAFRICLHVPRYETKERTHKEAKCRLLAGNPSYVRFSHLMRKRALFGGIIPVV
jgi:hypothetical protein